MGKTDWDKVNALTDEDIATAIEHDPDAAPIMDNAWFDNAEFLNKE